MARSYLDRRREAKRRRDFLRARAADYLGGKCRICGYDKCLSALEFHHIDPLEKDFAISDKLTSWEAIRAELDKCVLVCANCHREIHEGMHTGYLTDERADPGWEHDYNELEDDQNRSESDSASIPS